MSSLVGRCLVGSRLMLTHATPSMMKSVSTRSWRSLATAAVSPTLSTTLHLAHSIASYNTFIHTPARWHSRAFTSSTTFTTTSTAALVSPAFSASLHTSSRNDVEITMTLSATHATSVTPSTTPSTPSSLTSVNATHSNGVILRAKPRSVSSTTSTARSHSTLAAPGYECLDENCDEDDHSSCSPFCMNPHWKRGVFDAEGPTERRSLSTSSTCPSTPPTSTATLLAIMDELDSSSRLSVAKSSVWLNHGEAEECPVALEL